MRKKKPSSLPWDQRPLASINETAAILDIGRNSVGKLIAAGKLKTIEMGSIKRVTTESIRAVATAEAA